MRAARRLRAIRRRVRERLVGRIEPEPAAQRERHALVGGAADHVRLAGTHEGEERTEPAVGHVEHDLARLDARGGELLEHEVGEGAHVLFASGVGELPRAHWIERHHEPLAGLAPELGAASPAAVAHPDAHELETLHTARIAPDARPGQLFFMTAIAPRALQLARRPRAGPATIPVAPRGRGAPGAP